MNIVLLVVFLFIAQLKNSTARAGVIKINDGGKCTETLFVNRPRCECVPFFIDSVPISLQIDSEHKNGTNPDTSKGILRYGFQNTRDCPIFEKAFQCITKCLDAGYQMAYADSKCICSCGLNREIAEHKPLYFGPTKGTASAPTTSLPAWVKKHSSKLSTNDKFSPLNDYEIYGDVPFTNKTDTQQIKENSVKSPAESPTPESQAAESQAVESQAAESPAAESPAAESSAAESPGTESPATESSAAESPATDSQAAESPAESPAAESPETESPASESPAAEIPAAESPAAESPAAESPAAESPTAESP